MRPILATLMLVVWTGCVQEPPPPQTIKWETVPVDCSGVDQNPDGYVVPVAVTTVEEGEQLFSSSERRYIPEDGVTRVSNIEVNVRDDGEVFVMACGDRDEAATFEVLIGIRRLDPDDEA